MTIIWCIHWVRERWAARRHGGGRDDLPKPGSADCPAAQPVERRTDAGLEAHRGLDSRPFESTKIALQIGHSGARFDAPPMKPVSTSRWPSGGRQLADRWRVFAAMPRRREPTVGRPDARRDGPRPGRICRGDARADRVRLASNFIARMAICFRFHFPARNRRDDGAYLSNRLRYPLEVFRAVRAAWPDHLPMSFAFQRMTGLEAASAPADAVGSQRRSRRPALDLIDCSSGQVSKSTFGQMFQTPFRGSRARKLGSATIAVGAISEADHVNSIIAAGRADLCAVARPRGQSAWTLTEAAKIELRKINWPSNTARRRSR